MYTIKETKGLINTLNPKMDIITAKILKELPKKGLLKLQYIYNAVLRVDN